MSDTNGLAAAIAPNFFTPRNLNRSKPDEQVRQFGTGRALPPRLPQAMTLRVVDLCFCAYGFGF